MGKTKLDECPVKGLMTNVGHGALGRTHSIRYGELGAHPMSQRRLFANAARPQHQHRIADVACATQTSQIPHNHNQTRWAKYQHIQTRRGGRGNKQ